MSISFLHAADIHLDSPLTGLGRYENAPVEQIRNATRRAFERMIDLALVRRVDFVLIAGDLYDGDWRDYNTGLYLAGQLARLSDEGIPIVLIAGNHDAANKMTRILRLPERARLLAHDRPETVRLDDLGVAIHGQSFAKAAVVDNLDVAYPDPIPGYTNLGLLHTGLGGVDGHERYAPCSIEDLRARGYDYWALGHVHARGLGRRGVSRLMRRQGSPVRGRDPGPRGGRRRAGCVAGVPRPVRGLRRGPSRSPPDLAHRRWIREGIRPGPPR